jgi:hypothetical protein
VGKYNLHEECLVIAEDIEDLVLKLGRDSESLVMESCVSGHNAKVSGKLGLEAAGLLVEVDKWFDEVDWAEAAKVETVVGNHCKEIVTRQRFLGNRELGVVDAAGRKLIDWT